MRIADNLIMELEPEAKTTRRVLERVPEDKLTWRPHPKSMSLGQLALHVATTPGMVSNLAKADLNMQPEFKQAEAASSKELLDALDSSIAGAKEALNGWDDAKMMELWKFSIGDKTLMAMPRAVMLRAILFNHWYHHRGQLTVYLRLLDVAVPSVYGPSADENPFG
jgi:uncharacterized damage-inducible protein DinB